VGVPTVFSNLNSGLAKSVDSILKTSKPAPTILPSLSAAIRTFSLITPPRKAFIKIAVLFIK